MSDESATGIEARKSALWSACTAFVETHDIHTHEDVYQRDKVIESAYSFIEDVCEIVGYKPIPEGE